MQFKRGECVIRFGGIYMRGHRGQSCLMSLYQEQYIHSIFLCYIQYIKSNVMYTV